MSSSERADPTKSQSPPTVPPAAKQVKTDTNGTPLPLAERLLGLAVGESQTTKHWEQASPLTWAGLLDWLDLPQPATGRKEGRCFVAGTLRPTPDLPHPKCAQPCELLHRNKHAVVSRSVLALDADYASASFAADSTAALGSAMASYTTWSSTAEKPRWRLLLPLSRDVTDAEYRSIALAVMHELGIDQFDRTSVQPERLMYAPATQGSYRHHVEGGPALDADTWLALAKERHLLVEVAVRERQVVGGTPRDPLDGVHRYAAAGIEAELKRLDNCGLLGWGGEQWDKTHHDVACNLIEFGQSPWSGYTLDRAEADFFARAVTDEEGWGPAQHQAKWESALATVGDGGRTEPERESDFEVVGDPEFEKAVARRVNEVLIEVEVRRRVAEYQSVASGVQRLGAVDLTLVLDPSYEEPRPDILRLEDSDVCLLERGATHSINGDSGTGKSWLALLGVQQELDAGRHVVYIDCEDDAGRIVARLLALGVDREVIRARFSYRRPFGAWTEADVTGLVRYITEHGATLVVLDGVTDALALHGLSSNADTDVAVLFSAFGGRLAAAGPAVVFLDHITNEAADAGTATRGRGSGFKVGALSGTALFVDSHTPMGRGLCGHSHIAIGRKVRGGWLQEHTVDGPAANKRRVALLEVDASSPPVVAQLLRPMAKTGGASRELRAAVADDQMVEAITEVLASAKEPRSKNGIATAYRAAGHKGGQQAVFRVVDYMTEEGLAEQEGKRWRLPIRDTGS